MTYIFLQSLGYIVKYCKNWSSVIPINYMTKFCITIHLQHEYRYLFSIIFQLQISNESSKLCHTSQYRFRSWIIKFLKTTTCWSPRVVWFRIWQDVRPFYLYCVPQAIRAHFSNTSRAETGNNATNVRASRIKTPWL